MESYWITLFIVSLVLGIIPARIAQSKGKDFGTWYIYGVLLFFFAMIHAIVLPEKNENNERDSIKTVKSSLPNVNNNYILNELKYVDINCPIEARGFEIQVNEKTGLTYCLVNFFNLSEKVVSSVKFIIRCYDSFGQPVGKVGENEVETIIQDESVKSKEYFGINKPIALPKHLSTRKIDIIITDILFNDGSTWTKGDYELHELQVNSITNPQELLNLKKIVGNDAICYSKEAEDTWICVCNRLNHSSNEQCLRCGSNKDFVLKNCSNKESIEKAIDLLVLKEEHERKLLHQKEMELKLKKRKSLRRKVIFSMPFVIVFIIALSIGFATQFTFTYKGYELKKYKVNPSHINSILGDGSTYLSNSIRAKNTNMTNALIKYGADINIKTNTGETPLHSAVYIQNVELVKWLLDNKVDVNAKTNAGETPLYYAVSKDNIEISKLLIQNKADISIKTNNGETPLYYAAGRGNKELVKLLIKNGADVNTQTNDGETPLHYASLMKNLEMCELLVDSKADIDIHDNSGKTPLDVYGGTSIEDHDGTPLLYLLAKKGFYTEVSKNTYQRTSKE